MSELLRGYFRRNAILQVLSHEATLDMVEGKGDLENKKILGLTALAAYNGVDWETLEEAMHTSAEQSSRQCRLSGYRNTN